MFLLSNQRFPSGAPRAHVNCNAVWKGSFVKNLNLRKTVRQTLQGKVFFWTHDSFIKSQLLSEMVRLDKLQPTSSAVHCLTFRISPIAHTWRDSHTFSVHRKNGFLQPSRCSRVRPDWKPITFFGRRWWVRAVWTSWERQRGDSSCPPHSLRAFSINASLSSLLDSSSHSSSVGSGRVQITENGTV